jgi:hypothetical protein
MALSLEHCRAADSALSAARQDCLRQEVVAKLGGDPDLFWEPEPEAARQTAASTALWKPR